MGVRFQGKAGASHFSNVPVSLHADTVPERAGYATLGVIAGALPSRDEHVSGAARTHAPVVAFDNLVTKGNGAQNLAQNLAGGMGIPDWVPVTGLSAWLTPAPPLSMVPPSSSPVNWLNPVSGNWSDAANWSTGLAPNANNDVTISVAGTYTVTINAAESANSLTIDNSTATVAVSAAQFSVSTTIDVVAGHLSLAKGAVLGGQSVSVAAGSTLTENGKDSLNSALLNSGHVVVAGTLDLTFGGSLGGTVSGAGTLAITGGNVSVESGADIAPGMVLVDGGTLSVATGLDVTLAAPLKFGDVGGGEGFLSGGGTLTTTGSTSVADNGAGSFAVGPSGFGGITWVNAGTVSDAGGVSFAYNWTLLNQAGATFNLTSDDARLSALNPGASVSNAGTLAKTGGTGTSTIAVAVTNSGLLEAASGTLSVQAPLSNSGELLATSGAWLDLSQAVLANLSGTTLTGGSYEADANSTIELATETTITTLDATVTLSGAGSTIQSLSLVTGQQVTLDNTLATIGLNGTLALLAGRSFTAALAFTDNGLLKLGEASFTAMNGLMLSSTGTLLGNGTVAGAIGNSGWIDASGGILTVSGAVSSTGTLAAAAGATLDLTGGGSLGGTVSGAGTLAITGGNVSVESGADIAPGMVLVDGGTLSVATGLDFTLAAPLTLGDAGGGSGILSGGGILTTKGKTIVADNGAGRVAATLNGINWVNAGTVRDAGGISFQAANSTLQNQAGATFNLTSDDGSFYWNGSSGDYVSNAGTLAKTGGTGISAIGVAVNNTGLIQIDTGTLDVAGGGSLGGTVKGAGTLAITGSSILSVASGADIAPGMVLVDGGTLSVASGANVVPGMVLVDGGGALSVATGLDFTLAAPLTLGDVSGGTGALSGGGTLTTTGSTSVADNGAGGSAAALEGINWVNAGTVSDAGGISFQAGNSTLQNQAGATFNLTSDDGSFYWSLNGPASVSNAGTLAKTGGTGTSVIGVAVNNTGLIQIDTGTLDLAGGGSLGGTVSGAGTLAITGGTILSVASGADIAPGMVLVDGGGELSVATGLDFTLAAPLTFGDVVGGTGTLSGGGTLTTTGSTSVADHGGAALNGITWVNAGTVSDAGPIFLEAANSTLQNQADATFNLTSDEGSLIGSVEDFVVNAGTLAKTGGTGTSTIAAAVINSGLLEAASGTLALQGSLSNSGELLATSGAWLDLSHATLANLSGTTLTGGSYEAVPNAVIELASNTTITTLDATITLNGPGSTIQWLNILTDQQVTLDNTLATIGLTGTLALFTGRTFTAALAFTNNGLLKLGEAGGDIGFAAVKGLTISSTGTLLGYGGVTGAIGNSGLIEASGGTLTVSGALSGTGTLGAAAGATLDLTNAEALTGTLSGAGTLQLDNGTYTLAGSTAGIGSVLVDAGATLDLTAGGAVPGNIGGAGVLELSGAYTIAGSVAGPATVSVDAGSSLTGSGSLGSALAGAGSVTASGGTLTLTGAAGGTLAFQAAAGATLDLKGGGSLVGNVGGSGTVILDSALTFQSGATLTAANVLQTQNVTIADGETVTNAAGNHYTIQDAKGVTVSLLGSVLGKFSNAGTFTANGPGTVKIDNSVLNSGLMTAASGRMTFLAPTRNDGTIRAGAHTHVAFNGQLAGTGTLDIGASAAINLTKGASAGQTANFLSTTGTLDLGHPLNFLGHIAGFGSSDVIDLLKTAANGFTFAGNTLTLTESGTTVASLNLTGSYTSSSFTLASDNHGGTLIKFV